MPSPRLSSLRVSHSSAGESDKSIWVRSGVAGLGGVRISSSELEAEHDFVTDSAKEEFVEDTFVVALSHDRRISRRERWADNPNSGSAHQLTLKIIAHAWCRGTT
jgi:hypothetical protein